MQDESQAGRAAVAVARSASALAVAAAVAAVALPLLTGTGYLERLLSTPEAVLAPAYAAAGAWLAGHERSRRIGMLLVTTSAFAGCYVLGLSFTAWGEATGLGARPLAGAAAWLTTWCWIPPLGLVAVLLPLLLPEGRPLGGWWSRLPRVAVGLVTVATVVAAVTPRKLGFTTVPENPLGIDAIEPVVLPVGLSLLGGCVGLMLIGLASLVVRFRRADGVERRQVAWIGYGVAATVIATAVAPWWVRAFAALLIPACIVVAALRYRLYDIDVLVNRTLVAGALLAGAALVYAAVVGWAGSLLGETSRVTSFTAAFTIALLFHPARVRVQRAVDRLLYGDRADPHTLFLRVDDAIRGADSPRLALRDAATAVARGLRLRGVTMSVHLPDGADVETSTGHVDPRLAISFTLDLHGESVGVLHAMPRNGSAILDPQDRVVLAALTGPLASTAQAVRLTHHLERNRDRLVTTREEERRRLRRDLHDGLGPQLAAIAMTVDTAGRVLGRGDTGRTARLLGVAVDQTAEAIADVRRLVRGLRPPALDEFGLVGALTSSGLAATAAAEAGDIPSITVDAELDSSLELPAAVEVAAYRIVQEAVGNALRHDAPRQITVTLREAGDNLAVTVSDDGTGFDPAANRAGVGMASMRERAAELGGTVRLESAPGRGTTVAALLPLRPGDHA
ncbi:sensor histidine kinase [Nonomuraea sp. NPDC049400]|uniref:sensor histidine kinase n=1 Tax=Nonomuraea sp. NPDC049400 TaxID=3364352 RepID=UPI0037BC8680